MTYAFQADTYCDSCGESIRASLTREGQAPADPSDEWSYDSDEFPKGPFPEESTDGPDHCGAQGDCLEGIDLGEWGLEPGAELYGAETRTIGALLNEGLTEHGAAYLLELLDTQDPTPYQTALHRFWTETYSAEIFDALEAQARDLGAEHGRAAASWYFDGNTSAETYRAVLQGIEEGDPEIYDTFPSGPLSGEWADSPTPQTLAEQLALSTILGADYDPEALDEFCSAYEDGFYEASSAEIERVARYHADPQSERTEQR